MAHDGDHWPLAFGSIPSSARRADIHIIITSAAYIIYIFKVILKKGWNIYQQLKQDQKTDNQKLN